MRCDCKSACTGYGKDGRTLYGAANRTYSKAVDLAEKYNVSNAYENIEDTFNNEFYCHLHMGAGTVVWRQYLIR
ncbi:MAG: hypothetical protein ACI4V4_02295 [Eubacterium sp.]